MNIAEILKNAPKDTKLYSPIFGDVTFKCINRYIEVLDTSNLVREFYHDGKFYMNGECMIFPSRENRDWNTFTIFKKGDFLISETGRPFIFNGIINKDSNTLGIICGINTTGRFVIGNELNSNWAFNFNIREATEEEKNALICRINKEGYYWDYNTFILRTIKKKFNVYSLKPFDKILARSFSSDSWECDFFVCYNKEKINYPFEGLFDTHSQCVPYNDDTKHLLKTTENCPEYYKTW